VRVEQRPNAPNGVSRNDDSANRFFEKLIAEPSINLALVNHTMLAAPEPHRATEVLRSDRKERVLVVVGNRLGNRLVVSEHVANNSPLALAEIAKEVVGARI